MAAHARERYFAARPLRVQARFPIGTADLCASELTQLIAAPATPPKFQPTVKQGERWVRVHELDLRGALDLCLRSTIAGDLLIHLGSYPCQYENQIAKALAEAPLGAVLAEGEAPALRVVCTDSRLYHSGLVRELAVGALAQQGYGAKDDSDFLLELRIEQNELHLYVSAAGQPLHRRQYRRTLAHPAPLRETIAAAAVYFAHTALEIPLAQSGFYVPFAGSGTFGLEGLLRSGALAPGLFREHYAVERFPALSKESAAHARRKLRERVAPQSPIVFRDIEASYVAPLQENLRYFNECLAGHELPAVRWEVEHADFFTDGGLPERCENVGVLLNPPYGHRLSLPRGFYREIGQKLASFRGPRMVWGVLLIPPGGQEKAFLSAARPARMFARALRHGGQEVRCIAFIL